jgi:hypothetical protein
MVKVLQGLVVIPTVSRNEKHEFFHPDELPKFDNLRVPLKWKHGKDPDFGYKTIGESVFKYDKINQQVTHYTLVTDEYFQKYLDDNPVDVSFGAHYAKKGEDVRMCDKTGRCLDAPIIGLIDELSLVPKGYAGIAQADAKIVQDIGENPLIVNLSEIEYINTSNEPISETKTNNMSDSTEKIEQGTKITIETTDSIAEPKVEKVEQKVETPKVEEAKITQDSTSKVSDEVSKTIADAFEKIAQQWTPKSEVSEVKEDKIEQEYTDAEADKILQQLNQYGFARITINKEDEIAKHYMVANRAGSGKIEQAVSTSGTIPAVSADSEVVLALAGKTITPIRQFGKFKALPTGTSSHRFYRLSVPDAGAITESPTTDITAATHTLTSVTVSASVRGWRQTVERSEFEDNPTGFLNAIRESARVEAIRDEHRLITLDLGATDHDYGGTTTAPYHINLNDGTAVTTPTLEDACGEADFSGVVIVKQLLQQSHRTALADGSIIGFVHPRAWRTIASDTGLVNYTQFAAPQVTRMGELERLWGIDFIITNELEDENNSWRNIFAVKGEAWGLVSQREMNIQFQDKIAGQYTDIVWTHRIGVDVIQPTAYLIASSKKD